MTDTTPNHHDHDDVAAVAPTAAAPTTADHDGVTADVETVDEAADFVHPVDHGRGTEELPFEAEPAGSYVSGGAHGTDTDAVVDEEEKGDYVTPVDHGSGTRVDSDEESGDYVDRG